MMTSDEISSGDEYKSERERKKRHEGETKRNALQRGSDFRGGRTSSVDFKGDGC